MTNPNPTASHWPSNFQGCTITAQYLDLQGAPIVGTVTFSASPFAMLDPDDQIVVVPKVLTAVLDASGSLSIVVPATDDPDINPTNWTYAVSENFIGGRKYNIQAPQNTTVDLCDISPIPASNGKAIIRGPKGEAGGIQRVNGHTGDIVILSYADVGADYVGAAAEVQTALQAEIDTQTNAINARLVKANNLSDVTSASTARTNLGLDTAATRPATDFAPSANAPWAPTMLTLTDTVARTVPRLNYNRFISGFTQTIGTGSLTLAPNAAIQVNTTGIYEFFARVLTVIYTSGSDPDAINDVLLSAELNGDHDTYTVSMLQGAHTRSHSVRMVFPFSLSPGDLVQVGAEPIDAAVTLTMAHWGLRRIG